MRESSTNRPFLLRHVLVMKDVDPSKLDFTTQVSDYNCHLVDKLAERILERAQRMQIMNRPREHC